MRKTQVLAVSVAVLSLVVLVASTASATLWLITGKSLERETELKGIHGLWVVHHSEGLLGNYLFHCTGLFDGSVGPGALGVITKVLGLKGEENKIECEFNEGGTCGGGKVVSWIGLPWHTLLELLSNGKTVLRFLAESGKEFGYELPSCFQTCKNSEFIDFLENGVNGAIFHFLAEGKLKCTDGGNNEILGLGEMLGAEIS